MLEKISMCYNDPNISSTTKINRLTPSGYSIYTSCTFNKSYNKLSHYRGQDCMKMFLKCCMKMLHEKDLKDHAKKIINHKKKSITLLTKDEEDSYNKDTIYVCKNSIMIRIK